MTSSKNSALSFKRLALTVSAQYRFAPWFFKEINDLTGILSFDNPILLKNPFISAH